MPRNLPWLNNNTKAPEGEPKTTPAPKRRHHIFSSDVEDEPDVGGSKTKKAQACRSNRTPSTSPPPAPPCEEFMKGGLPGDDIWIMVEDEFLATAHLFTQHLHRAEYKRLKQIAKKKNANVMHTLSRPIDPRAQLSAEAKKRLEAEAMTKLQRDSIAKSGGVEVRAKTDEELLDEEFEDPWLRDSHLAGLMSGSQVKSARLDGIMGVKSNTRAAAGYSKATADTNKQEITTSARTSSEDVRKKPKKSAVLERHGTATEDEDEGDLSVPRRAAPKAFKSSTSTYTTFPNECRQMRPPEKRPPNTNTQNSSYSAQSNAGKSQPRQRSAGHTGISTKKWRPNPLEDDDVDIRPRREGLSAGFAARIAKRKTEMAAKKEREEKGKKKSIMLDELPTFLV